MKLEKKKKKKKSTEDKRLNNKLMPGSIEEYLYYHPERILKPVKTG